MLPMSYFCIVRNLMIYKPSLVFLFSLATVSSLLIYKKYWLQPVLQENSGVWRRADGSLLWINDSGNSPNVYLSDSLGQELQPFPLPCQNRDWEEITGDDKGNIYIGDFGNNSNQRRDLCIYILDRTLHLADSIHFKYADQIKFPPAKNNQQFDLEAMVWRDGKLHLFTKDKAGNTGISRHYLLNDRGHVQIALPVQTLYLNRYIVSGAARDSRNDDLFLLTYRYKSILGFLPDSDARIFTLRFSPGTDTVRFTERKYYTIPTWFASSQYEAITVLPANRWLISAEGQKNLRPFFRILPITR